MKWRMKWSNEMENVLRTVVMWGHREMNSSQVPVREPVAALAACELPVWLFSYKLNHWKYQTGLLNQC